MNGDAGDANVLTWLKNVLVMIELELRRLRHDKTELYIRAVQPVLWLVVFGPVMGAFRAIETGGIPYTAYITPGVLIHSTTFVSIFYGLQIVWERESGILKRLLVTPSARYAIVLGRAMASGVRSLFQVCRIVPFALLIGVQFRLDVLGFLGMLAMIFFSSGGFASISIIVASFMKSRERFMGIGQAVIFPLYFMSSALYPVSQMPPVIQAIARFNPMSYIVDGVRGLIITGTFEHTLLVDFGVLVVFVLVMFALATLSFKKIIE